MMKAVIVAIGLVLAQPPIGLAGQGGPTSEVEAANDAPALDAAGVADAGGTRTATITQDPAAQAPSGLPERAPQARTMRAYWHVFIAFGVTWLLLFGYAVSIGRRFGRLETELRRIDSTGPRA